MRPSSHSQSRSFPKQSILGRKKRLSSQVSNALRMPWFKRQNFRPTARSLLTTLFIYSCLQSGLHNGVTTATLTSIQRRYGLGAAASGFFVSCYDLGVVLFVSWVCYLAHRKKGAWLGGGHAIMGIGSLIYALPQFLGSKYSPITHGDDWELCGVDKPSSQPDSGADSDHNLWYFFILANLVIGGGSCALYTVGPEYLDDNVPQKARLSMFMGIFYAASALGPLVGFVGSGVFLNFWVDLTTPPDGLESDDKEWVGAWWLPFIVIAILSFFNSAYLYNLPDKVSDASFSRNNSLGEDDSGLELMPQQSTENGAPTSEDRVRDEEDGGEKDNEGSRLLQFTEEKQDEGDDKTAIMRDMYDQATSVREFLIGFMAAARDLLKNRLYILSVCQQITNSMAISSASVHTPRIVESVFGLSSSETSIKVGATIVPGAVLGILAGGYYCSKRKLDVKGIYRFQRAVSLICLCLLFLLVLIPPLCSSRRPDFAGITGSKETNNTVASDSDFIRLCNEDCGCDLKEVEPVCGSDHITYLSPCIAGCSLNNDGVKGSSANFTDCACVGDEEQSATLGQCAFACPWIYLYLLLLFSLLFFVTSQTAPQTEVILRVVRPRLRAFGLAWSSIAFRVFGTIPGPIFVGLFIDSTCLKWSNSESDNSQDKGDCILYDVHRLSLAYLPITIPCVVLSAAFATIALHAYDKWEKNNSQTPEKQSVF